MSEIVDRFPYPASKLREFTGFLTFISSLIEHLLVTGLLIGQDLKVTPFGIYKIVTHFLKYFLILYRTNRQLHGCNKMLIILLMNLQIISTIDRLMYDVYWCQNDLIKYFFPYIVKAKKC